MRYLNLKNDKKIFALFLLCALAFVGGSLNGFVGTGGGIVFIFTLSLLTKNEKKDNYVTTLFSIIPISLIGSFSYFSGGGVDISILNSAYLPSIFGGVLGALLVDKIRVKWLNLFFGVLVIYSGINLLIR